MPIYEYRCATCDTGFEQLMRSTSADAPPCPACSGSRVERKLSAFAVGGGGAATAPAQPSGDCGSCGDPRGPGACQMN